MCVECGCQPAETTETAAVTAESSAAAERVAAPADGEVVQVRVGDTTVAVAMVDGTPYAIDDLCTHQQCSLAGGEVEGHDIICPCHEGRYDLRTGAVISGPPPKGVRAFPVRILDGELQVEVS